MEWLQNQAGVHVRVTLLADPTGSALAHPGAAAAGHTDPTLGGQPAWWAVSFPDPTLPAGVARVACAGALSACPLAATSPCNLALPDPTLISAIGFPNRGSAAAAGAANLTAGLGSVAIQSASGCGAGAPAPEEMAGAQLLYGLKVHRAVSTLMFGDHLFIATQGQYAVALVLPRGYGTCKCVTPQFRAYSNFLEELAREGVLLPSLCGKQSMLRTTSCTFH